MNPRPIEAGALDNKTLLVKFNNGEMKKVDTSVFLAMRRKAQFAMVHLTAKTESELKQILDELIQNSIPIFDKKLKRVILFGSYARGDYDEESDIDVMFLIDDDAKTLSSKYRKAVRRIIADIDWKYEVLLCSLLQNEQDFYAAVNSIPFYHNVEKEGITLYEQQPITILPVSAGES